MPDTPSRNILRTPDERFAGLPDWPFEPQYLEVDGLRIAFVDEGPRDAPPVLLMHGEPTWSYLYRHVIAALKDRFRVVVPDLVGFGRSDKPADVAAYSYEAHVGWMLGWLRGLDLRGVTLFCQDWGGLIGLRLVAAEPDRFAAVIAANTGLPEGTGATEAFHQWVAFSQSVPEFPVSAIVDSAALRLLQPAELAAYDAPFPDEGFKAGARAFPPLVPVTPGHPSVAENKAAWAVLEEFDRPFVTAFSDSDPITRGGERIFQQRVPGAEIQRHVALPGGHFLQEDCPQEIAALIARVAASA
jgi:haloalkane dehalogenase